MAGAQELQRLIQLAALSPESRQAGGRCMKAVQLPAHSPYREVLRSGETSAVAEDLHSAPREKRCHLRMAVPPAGIHTILFQNR